MKPNLCIRLIALLLVPCLAGDPVMASMGPSIPSIQIAGRHGGLPLQWFTSQALADPAVAGFTTDQASQVVRTGAGNAVEIPAAPAEPPKNDDESIQLNLPTWRPGVLQEGDDDRNQFLPFTQANSLVTFGDDDQSAPTLEKVENVRLAARGLWKLIGDAIRTSYGDHRAFRIGSQIAIPLLGLLALSPQGDHVVALLNQYVNHHFLWTIVGISFMAGVVVAQAGLNRFRWLPRVYRQSYLFLAANLFGMVVVCSAITVFILPDRSVFALSCLFRNAVVWLWALRGFLKLSGYLAGQGPRWIKWLFGRINTAAVSGVLMILSGPQASLHLFDGKISSQAMLLHSRGFWDWIVGMDSWLICTLWLLWPTLTRLFFRRTAPAHTRLSAIKRSSAILLMVGLLLARSVYSAPVPPQSSLEAQIQQAVQTHATADLLKALTEDGGQSALLRLCEQKKLEIAITSELDWILEQGHFGRPEDRETFRKAALGVLLTTDNDQIALELANLLFHLALENAKTPSFNPAAAASQLFTKMITGAGDKKLVLDSIVKAVPLYSVGAAPPEFEFLRSIYNLAQSALRERNHPHHAARISHQELEAA